MGWSPASSPPHPSTQSEWPTSTPGWSTPTPPPPQPLPPPEEKPISITDDELPYETHNTYTITFFSTPITTTVTHDPTTVSNWLSSLNSTSPLTIGLDVEWRPNFSKHIQNPVATLQLCVGTNCLVFQLIHAPSIPKALVDFLSNGDNVFVGIGIKVDLEKLEEDWEFGFRTNLLDLRGVAAERFGDGKLRKAGLKELAKVVLGRDVPKPKRVTMSRWDYQWLTPDQVMYATVDAFVCFEIARVLNDGGSASA